MAASAELLVHEQVMPAVVELINTAKEAVTMVSPYLKPWRYALDALELAVERKVRVTLIVRSDDDIVNGEEVVWSLDKGIRVFAVKLLHAKIYMNERTVLVSSMNLTESSKDSLDVAIRISDGELQQEIRRYVAEKLMPLAVQVPKVGLISEGIRVAAQAVRGLAFSGTCIRCGRGISLDPSKPLCEECYEVWASYGNPEYEESFCHSCGQPRSVSYGRPLCGQCYARSR